MALPPPPFVRLFLFRVSFAMCTVHVSWGVAATPVLRLTLEVDASMRQQLTTSKFAFAFAAFSHLEFDVL